MSNLKAAPWNQNPTVPQPPGVRSGCRRNICAEVDWIETILEHDPSRSVLNVSAGVSRQSAELARRGYPVTWVDLSRSLPVCSQTCEFPLINGIDVVRKDLGSLNLERLASFAFCMSTGVFSMLERDDMDLFLLRQLAGSLRRGGHLLLTAPNAAYLMAHEPQLFNPLTRRSQQTVDTTHTGGDSCPTPGGQRWYTPLEITWLLNRVGLRLERFFAVSQNGFNPSDQPGKDCESFGVLAVRA